MSLASIALALSVLLQDAPIATARPSGESADTVRQREALAYATPAPKGAPTEDYALVAWCEARVNGHVRLGESLTSGDPLDLEIMRLGRLEAVDFRSALATARGQQTAASLRRAEQAVDEMTAQWAPIMRLEEEDRSRAFGLFDGLPGRCEHAARRIRENITAAPARLPESQTTVAPPPSSAPKP